MPKVIDLTNKRFGRLKVIEKTNLREGSFVVWKCLCDCGNEKLVSSRKLLSGGVRSCGCLQKENGMSRFRDLTNKRFGRLKVIEKTDLRRGNFVVWKCLCDCGNEKLVTSRNLLSGSVKSCGCFQKESRYKTSHFKDITGNRYGKLTVIELVNPGTRGKCARWLCQCDCGKQHIASYGNLVEGGVTSCGCIHSENGVRNMKLALEHNKNKEWVDKTYLALLNRNLSSANTSGVKGVYVSKRSNRYIAEIKFQGKKYHLGTFKDINEAKKAREKAEKELWNPILKTYSRSELE